ncbi:hypothetical protein BOTNAR_0158g00210 [Botryotinia narcissicola]|uniref:Uncharacterized protein n=1 Tax=Botryotinia narcissicola TaxID=278944 RepID=A0A4Z1IE58_9HELO|nr:hypothetical protein BOTNAR_0158g00210 [Botryotinia narcissicola]
MRSQHKSLVLRIPLPRWTNFNRPKLPRVHHFSKYPDAGEPAKFVFDNRCKFIALDLVLLALPLATTASLVYLNMRSVYWGDTQTNGTWQNTMLNSLQFAAKLHELWIGSSVAYIVPHFIVFMLAKAIGIPFGLLGAGLQIGDLKFFARRSFWSSFECSHGRKLSIYLFALFALFCSILTALAGPSSAIAMRPNLDWWQMTNTTLIFRFPTKFELWPINLLEPLAPPLSMVNCSNYADSSANFICPASGAQDINTWLNSQDFNVLKGKATNMTFYSVKCNIYAQSNLTSAGNDRADAPVFPLLHGIMKNTSTLNEKIGYAVPKDSWDGWSTVQDTLIIPCTFDARWLQTQVKYEPTTSDIITDNITDSTAFSELQSLINNAHQDRTKKKPSELNDVINITPGWAAYTNIVVPGVHLTQKLTQDLTAPIINFSGGMHATPTFPAPAPAQNLPNATLIQGLLNRFMVLGANGTLSFN